MVRILLISDKRTVFVATKKAVKNEYDLIWNSFDYFENTPYPKADLVILHLALGMVPRRMYKSMIRIKSSMGKNTPILAIVEEGTLQEIYSTLKMGAYDYLRTVQDISLFREKIEEAVRWNWYVKKYVDTKQ